MTPAAPWTEKLESMAVQTAAWLARWGNLGEEPPPDAAEPCPPRAGTDGLAELQRRDGQWDDLSQRVTAELRQWQQELDELAAAIQQWQQEYRQLLQWLEEGIAQQQVPRQPA